MASDPAWPALPYEEWAPTKRTLHLCSQMLGKSRLALAPPQPEWLHTCLYLYPGGLTTGPMPAGSRLVSMGLDLHDPALWLRSSDGREDSIPLRTGGCIADIWSELKTAQALLGLDLDMWEKPQEMPDTTPFADNTDDCTVVPADARRFHRILCATAGVFEEFRSQFFGRTGVQFWWGSFDLAVLLFNGKKLAPPEERGYIMRYDLDAEHLNAGFWPGSDDAPAAGFYAYLVPQPPGCATAPIEPEQAGWVEAMGEWMIPYDAVRGCPDPRAAILDFLGSIYRFTCAQEGWGAASLTYTKPGPPIRR